MRYLSNRIAVFAWPVITVFFIAGSNEKVNNSVTKPQTSHTLIYSYVDRSVSPQYHRSYTIRVTPAKVYFSIDAYSKIIASDSFILKKAAYDSFAKAVNHFHIKKKKLVENKGCTGGTTDKLELYPSSSKEVKGYIYHCGTKAFGDLEGDISSTVSLFKALIPDLQLRIDATRQNN